MTGKMAAFRAAILRDVGFNIEYAPFLKSFSGPSQPQRAAGYSFKIKAEILPQ
jgi:hypothetical protein